MLRILKLHNYIYLYKLHNSIPIGLAMPSFVHSSCVRTIFVVAIIVRVFHNLPEMCLLESCAPVLALSVCSMMIVLFPPHTLGWSLVKSIDGVVSSGILFI